MQAAFVADDTLEQLSTTSQVGQTRLGGNRYQPVPHANGVGGSARLGPCSHGFCLSQFAAQVRALCGQTGLEYGRRRAAYDLKRIRAKDLVEKIASSRRYHALPQGVRTNPLGTP